MALKHSRTRSCHASSKELKHPNIKRKCRSDTLFNTTTTLWNRFSGGGFFQHYNPDLFNERSIVTIFSYLHNINYLRHSFPFHITQLIYQHLNFLSNGLYIPCNSVLSGATPIRIFSSRRNSDGLKTNVNGHMIFLQVNGYKDWVPQPVFFVLVFYSSVHTVKGSRVTPSKTDMHAF